MRTTVNIDEHLLAEAKILAARTHRSLGQVVDDALRVLLGSTAQRVPRAPVDLPVYGGGGLRAGVDLEDKEGLAELLDETARRAAG